MRRVVVTGLGAITPIGNNVKDFFENVKAEKTGFSQQDADIVKECLRTLFVNDASSARPEGSMEVVRLYWWEHSCKDGQYSSAKVHRSVHVVQKETAQLPSSVEDYVITMEELPGLTPVIIDGV